MKRFCTSYDGPDGRYCGHVDALDWEHAQAQCDARGRGETVDGVLYLEIPAEGMTHERADEMTKAMAETGYGFDDAPDATEFNK